MADVVEAGREMDAAVERAVFGGNPISSEHPDFLWLNGRGYLTKVNGEYWVSLGWYSTEIDAAWLVVERLHELGFWTIINYTRRDDVKVLVGKDLNTPQTEEYGETAPLAICRAALAAVADEKVSRKVSPMPESDRK